MDILGCDASTLSDAVKRGAIRPAQVLDAYFQQIDTVNPHINAIVQSNREMAYEQAAWIERELPRLQHKRLLGVPFSVKNTCHALGYSPDKGCAGLAGQASETDATVVARLRGEGALLLGLTNTPELSIGYETDNLLYGQTRNPHDLTRSPGGSSGGEAALIAAQGSLLGIGSDASGSLRVPAHNSGICTLRLTQGRVPLTGHFPLDCMGMFSPFISFGPMARTIADLRLAAPLLAGPDGRDPHVPPVPWHTASPRHCPNCGWPGTPTTASARHRTISARPWPTPPMPCAAKSPASTSAAPTASGKSRSCWPTASCSVATRGSGSAT